MVVALKSGVINVVPVPTDIPPDGTVYQLTVPVLGEAPSVTVPVPHLEAGVVFVIVGTVLTMARTIVLAGLVQPLLVAST